MQSSRQSTRVNSAILDVNGVFTIQPVELFRVFDPVNGNGHTEVNGEDREVNDSERFASEVNTLALSIEIDQLRVRLTDKRK